MLFYRYLAWLQYQRVAWQRWRVTFRKVMQDQVVYHNQGANYTISNCLNYYKFRIIQVSRCPRSGKSTIGLIGLPSLYYNIRKISIFKCWSVQCAIIGFTECQLDHSHIFLFNHKKDSLSSRCRNLPEQKPSCQNFPKTAFQTVLRPDLKKTNILLNFGHAGKIYRYQVIENPH